MSEDKHSVTMTADAQNAPAKVREFAERMAKAQGCKVRLASEGRGYHLYIPCPTCLETHQRGELEDPKYAINVSKHLALGDAFRELRMGAVSIDPTEMENDYQSERTRNEKVGICMRTRQSKTPHIFPIPDLLRMTTITERWPDLLTKAEVMGQAGNAEREKHWETDAESGILCPPPPGEVIPITELPPSHPAVIYLTQRGYDLQKLWHQFRCSFCVEEYKEGKNDIYYRKFPSGWKDTPQHRIIFYSMVNGAPMTWQGRYPEWIATGPGGAQDRYMLHPYYRADGSISQRDRHAYGVTTQPSHPYGWSRVATRPQAQSPWIPVPPFDETDDTGELRFNPSKGKPSKYRTAKYSIREMMGWDAALERADNDPAISKWVVLCEGPLDAARVGPGGVALIGSSISPENAVQVASNFHVVFTAFDNDLAGRAATERIGRQLLGGRQRNPMTQIIMPLRIEGDKDIGDMTQGAFDAMLKQAIKRSLRGTA